MSPTKNGLRGAKLPRRPVRGRCLCDLYRSYTSRRCGSPGLCRWRRRGQAAMQALHPMHLSSIKVDDSVGAPVHGGGRTGGNAGRIVALVATGYLETVAEGSGRPRVPPVSHRSASRPEVRCAPACRQLYRHDTRCTCFWSMTLPHLTFCAASPIARHCNVED